MTLDRGSSDPHLLQVTTLPDLLPPHFAAWFRARGWSPHPYQLEMVQAARDGRSVLLTAPTGGGKTLAGFLPSLVELSERPAPGLHTLYVSPLKALAVDIGRNLETPIAELGLPIACETRTGDTPSSKRQRQRRKPPQFLLTTPESLALLISYEDAGRFFAGLRCVVVDELHALAGSKRGELLALGLARLRRLAPAARFVGLSATVAWPQALAAYLGPDARLIAGAPGPVPAVGILAPGRVPWAGHSARHAIPAVLEAIRAHRTSIVFVNTRSQAEAVFQELWRLNDDNLAIALHHGSLAAEQRRKVEAAMARGTLRAVVATSSLDLGIDWAAVDLVIQIGAPKGSSRLIQRVGRANHRLDCPSRALLVPANRFEVVESLAALEAVREGALDGDPPRRGGLDVLAQHVLGTACAGPFAAEALFEEVRGAAPYAGLSRADFDDVLAFVASGGYALGNYEQFRRLVQDPDGRWRTAKPAVARQYRMNVGTIVEAPMLRIRLRRGPVLGEVEELFVQALAPGDTFVFAGQVLRFEGIRDLAAEVTRAAAGSEPKVPAYLGGRLPLTTHIAERVRAILADPAHWLALPEDVAEWLRLQAWRSTPPQPGRLLVESFPRHRRHYAVVYGFAGRNAHQTLGMLMTRRMERTGLRPLGFVASDYAVAAWSLRPVEDVAALLDEGMLGDDLEEWLAESNMLKRTFRTVAVIAGLVERRHPGHQKSGRQLTFSADLIYEVLRKHEPGHVLLRATRAEAAHALTDLGRLSDLLAAAKGRIDHRRLDRVSPLAVPILLDIGRESVSGAAVDDLLAEAAAELAAEAARTE